MSRSNVIAGRYVSFALLALLGIAAGLLVTLVMVAVAPDPPPAFPSWRLMMNFSWQAMLFASVAGLAIILVMLSVTMPLFSRFGMTKGVRYLPLLIIIGVFFAFQLDGNGPPPEFVANVLNLLESPAAPSPSLPEFSRPWPPSTQSRPQSPPSCTRSASSSGRKRSAP